LIDVITAQHEAVLASTFGRELDAHSAEFLAAAQELLIHSVVPFELASRGYADANQSLRTLNDTLQQRTAELTQVTADLVRREQQVGALNAELEQRVIERTAALEHANHELESFSYSVSHDLRAPLRAINGFSRILLAEHAEQLVPEAHAYLEAVRDNALQMGALVDNLLNFSRLSREALRKSHLLPADIVRNVLADLAPELEGRQVEVTGSGSG
jgi:signal transduction histidine kinase